MAAAHIWKARPYTALFADSFVEGTELEGGHIANGIGIYLLCLSKMLDDDEKRSILLSLFDEVCINYGYMHNRCYGWILVRND